MRLAVLQSAPCSDEAQTLAEIGRALAAAGAAGAVVLVAPEICFPGYNRDDIPARAQPRGGDLHDRLAALCRAAGCGLVIGYAERDGDRLYNSAAVFDAAGNATAHYRKIQLYGPRENALFSPGTAYCLFDLGGRRAAVLICYDIEFAPHVAALAREGVEVILVPTANMMPFTHVPRVTVPAMAANHGTAIAYANWCGVEGDLTYTGGSQVAGPHGEVLALAGEHPALLVADLPPRDALRLSTQARDLRSL